MTDRPTDNTRGSEDSAAELFMRVWRMDAVSRQAALEEACGHEPELRARVEIMLRNHDAPAEALETLEGSAALRRSDGHPERIGDFRILDLIGRGGMGVVYRAQQERPRRVVAIKIVLPELAPKESSAKRLAKEAEILAHLQHPGIASIYAAGSCDLGYGQTPYLAMEFVDGVPLSEFVHTHALDTRTRARLLSEICDAVQHAHERGVVHRDLKPSNILVFTSESGPQAKILDFGIARLTDESSLLTTLHTNTGQLLGTLAYMSPEQVGGRQEEIGTASDVYALGVLLYEALTGVVPHEITNRSLADAAHLIQHVEPTRLASIKPDLRGDLETICEKAMAKEPGRRYPSAAAFGADLRAWLGRRAIAARRPTTWYQLRKFASRNRTLVAGVLASVVALLLGLATTGIYAHRASKLAARESAARLRADAAATTLEEQLYEAEMRLAADAISMPTGTARIRKILSRWNPSNGKSDYRGWEWHLLRAHVRACEDLHVGGIQHWKPVEWFEADQLLLASRLHGWKLGHLDLASTRFDQIGGFDISLHQVSRNRDWLVTNRHRHLQIRRYPSGEIARTWKPPGRIVLAQWSVDDRLLAMSIADMKQGKNRLLIRDLETRETVADWTVSFAAHEPLFDFTRDGKHFLFWDHARKAFAFYKLANWKRAREVALESKPMRMATSPDGEVLALAWRNGSIRIHELESAAPRHRLHGHRSPIYCLRWSADSRKLASGAADGTIRVWDRTSLRERAVGSRSQAIHALAWSPDARSLASGPQLGIWDVSSPPAARTIRAPRKKHRAGERLQWIADGKRLVHTSGKALRVYDLEQERWTRELRVPTASVRSDGRAISYRRDGVQIERVDLLDDQSQRNRPVTFDNTDRGALRFGNEHVAFAAQEGVFIWKPGEEAQKASGGFARGLAWSRRDGRLAIANWSHSFVVYDPRSAAKTVHKLSNGHANGIAWSPIDDRIAIAHQDQTVTIRSASSLENVVTLLGHAAAAFCVAWSPDASRLASGGADRRVRIWDLARRREVFTLKHDANLAALAWSPDGKILASLSQDGCIKLWDSRRSPR